LLSACILLLAVGLAVGTTPAAAGERNPECLPCHEYTESFAVDAVEHVAQVDLDAAGEPQVVFRAHWARLSRCELVVH